MSVATAPPAHPGDHRMSQPARRLKLDTVTLLVLIGALCGTLSLAGALPELVRMCLVLTFVSLAPGNATLMWWRGLSRAARTGLPAPLGLAFVVMATTLGADLKWWHPGTTVLALAAASVVSVGIRLLVGDRYGHLRLDASSDRPLHTTSDNIADATSGPGDASRSLQSRIGRWAVPALLGLAAIAWATCLPTIGSAQPSAYGLLAAASPGYLISIVFVAVAGLIAIARRSLSGMFGATAGIIVIEHVSATLATAVPIYPWTYKHIGVVDYIDRFGYVVRGTDVYHNWPGMFTTMAWLHDLTGIDVLTLAHWFTPVYHLALVPLVYATARAWRRPPVVAAATAFVFEVCSFLAQDYFSPQALGYLLGLAVLLVLGESSLKRSASTIALVLFAAITVTHQLTPYWLIVTAVALVAFRRIKPWWLPVAFAAIAGGYLLLNYATIKRYAVVASPDPIQNIRLGSSADPVFGIKTQFWTTEFLYVILFGGAALTLFLALRRRQEWRAPAAIAFAPILLLAVQGYGGEAIFRVLLFALPGISGILAMVLVRVLGRSALRMSARKYFVGISALGLVVAVTSAHVLLGSFSAYKVRESEVAAWSTFNRVAPISAVLYSVGPGFPGNPQWQYVPRVTAHASYANTLFGLSSKLTTNFASDADYDTFMDIITAAQQPGRALFFVLSAHMQDYGQLYGVFPRGVVPNLGDHMIADKRWVIVMRQDGTTLLRLAAT